ncbi:MAG: XisH family protein [Caldilineaceae bacterium]
MSAKDLIHDAVKNALHKDGWRIIADPYVIKYGDDQVFVDLAAEHVIAIERAGRKIIVEIKSFAGRSAIQDLKIAVGQYMVYLPLVAELAPEYKLYVAISQYAYLNEFQRDIVKRIIEQYQVPLLIVDIEEEQIVEWIR